MAPLTLIDTHAHIYLEEFGPDGVSMLENAEKEGVTRILMPAIDSATHARMLDTEAAAPGRCLAMMGLHPCSVKENFREELKIVGDFLEKRSFVAVGETGLDFYWDLTWKDQQYEAFRQQLEWALHYDIPVVIHSRNSTDACIELVAAHQKGALKGVFHCFSGNEEQARRVMDLGFYLGIGGVLTFKNSGLDKVVSALGTGRVVLETDAPYLAPVPFRGKRNEPAYLKYVLKKMEELLQIPAAELAEITTRNAENLFGKLL